MKEFNVTGNCIPKENYMCDMSAKFARCKELIEKGRYYAINFPRQHGKTTMRGLLRNELIKDSNYFVISTSFAKGDAGFENEATLAPMILKNFANALKLTDKDNSIYLRKKSESITSLEELGIFYHHLCRTGWK